MLEVCCAKTDAESARDTNRNVNVNGSLYLRCKSGFLISAGSLELLSARVATHTARALHAARVNTVPKPFDGGNLVPASLHYTAQRAHLSAGGHLRDFTRAHALLQMLSVSFVLLANSTAARSISRTIS